MKLIRNLVLLLVVLFAAAVLGKNAIAKSALLAGTKMVAGLDASVDSVTVGLFSTSLGVKGLKVKNPSGFPEPLMLDMPELFIDYDLPAFLKGEVHLETVRLNLAEFHVVNSADGQLNINSIKALQKKEGQPAGGKEQAKSAEQSKGTDAPMKMAIDNLELIVGKVVYTDHKKSPAAVQTFNVNLNEKHTNISNPYSLAGIIVSRALMNTAVAQLTNFDVKGLQAGVTQALNASAGEALKQATQVTGSLEKIGKDAVGDAGDTAQKSVDQAADTIKDAAGTFKKLLGN